MLQTLIEHLQVMPLPDAPNATGRDKNTLLAEFIAGPGLTIGGIVKRHLYNGFLHRRFDPVLHYRLPSANFL